MDKVQKAFSATLLLWKAFLIMEWLLGNDGHLHGHQGPEAVRAAGRK